MNFSAKTKIFNPFHLKSKRNIFLYLVYKLLTNFYYFLIMINIYKYVISVFMIFLFLNKLNNIKFTYVKHNYLVMDFILKII